jgi:multidrug efflux pump subunit AcrB
LPLPAFSIIIIFVIFVIVGIAVMPLLSVRLEPSHTSNDVTVKVYWPAASSEKLEREVTAKLEGIIATVKGIKNIRSVSANSQAYIQVELNGYVSKEACRFEIATLIRQVYPHLPRGVRYPVVYANGVTGEKDKSILSYTINGKATAANIKQVAEKLLKPSLALTEGVSQINIYGTTDFAWELQFNTTELLRYKLSTRDISDAITNYFQTFEAGKAYVTNETKQGNSDYIYLTLKTSRSEDVDWKKIPVTKQAGRILFLTDIARVQYVEQEPGSYYRVNGLNTVNLEIVAAANTNYITLAEKIKARMNSLQKSIPKDYSIILSYDATAYLKNELNKITLRTLATLFILLLFVLVTSRSLRYLLFILLSLVANLLVSNIFYYFLKLEINLYSLAGVTISMGLMIDKSIVIIDHIRNKGNLRVFLAIAGATFTTIGAVCIIFFLDHQQQLRLLDFTWVIIINLGVSLMIALFFIPALMEKLPVNKTPFPSQIKRKRRVVAWNRWYLRRLSFAARFKPVVILVMILLFGIPVFMLPAKVEKSNVFAKVYNSVMGSQFYNEQVKPWLNIGMGGTLRLFVSGSSRFSYAEASVADSYIKVDIGMPQEATTRQMNDVVLHWENFLSQFKQIDQVQSRVYNGQKAQLEIRFKKEFENGDFPYTLKSQLESKAVFTGLADFRIYGIGDGFNNKLNKETTNYGITLQGYNYEKLFRYAEQVKSLLQENTRVEKINIGSTRDPEGEKMNYEFVFRVNSQEKLLENNLSPQTISNALTDLSENKSTVSAIFYKGSYVPVILSPANERSSVWQVMNQPVVYDSGSYVRLKDFAAINKEKGANEIVRQNQQYQLVVNYNFIGDNYYASLVSEKIADQVSKQLPLGFSIKQQQMNFWSGAEKKLTWAVFLTVAIVFSICAILLNSLRQSLAVIAMVPISFVGLFITSWLFEYNFDEGGYVAFIVLCGVVVNAALFILNDFNNLKRDYPAKPLHLLYIKAYNSKIIPVILSKTSMILGLAPFIIDSKQEPFWYPLAMSVAGGVLFSMIAILLFLPLFLKGIGSRKSQNLKKRAS